MLSMLAFCAQYLSFNDEFIEYFDDDIAFRQDTDFMSDKLGGMYEVQFSHHSQQEQGIFETDYLFHQNAFKDWLLEQPEVRFVYSYSELQSVVQSVLHESPIQLPETKEQAAENYLMLQLALPDDSSLDHILSASQDASALKVFTANLSSTQMQAFLQRCQDWQKSFMPEKFHSMPTGPAVMFAYISKRNIDSMMVGNYFALGMISFILAILLKSLPLFFLSLAANLSPLVMMFGIWALMSGEVGMVGTTIAAATLGIVVDDTVHFLCKYLHARRQLQYTIAQAVEMTLSTVGVAISATSLVLVIGLSVLLFSDFLLNYQAGVLTIITIICAWLFDLLVLPAVLLVTGRFVDSQYSGKASNQDCLVE